MNYVFKLCKAFLKVKDQFSTYFAVMFFFGFFGMATQDIGKLPAEELEKIYVAVVCSMFFGYLLITLPLELINFFVVDEIEKKWKQTFDPTNEVYDLMSNMDEEKQLLIYGYAYQVREELRAERKQKRLARRQNNHSFFFQRVWIPIENIFNKPDKENKNV